LCVYLQHFPNSFTTRIMHSVGARIYLHIFVETAGQQSLFQGLMVLFNW